MFYFQKDSRWEKEKLGSCQTTLGASSCFITSLCNLNKIIKFMGEINPSEMNKLCLKYGFYTNGCLLNAPALAKFLKLNYSKQITAPKDICICETSYYKDKGIPQHFYLYNPKTDLIIDPLDP